MVDVRVRMYLYRWNDRSGDDAQLAPYEVRQAPRGGVSLPGVRGPAPALPAVDPASRHASTLSDTRTSAGGFARCERKP